MTMDAVRYTVSGGLTLAADATGPADGVPLLFLHGGGQTRGAWGRAIRMFGDLGYRAMAIDLRGHGASDWAPDGDYSLDAAARDIREVVGGFGRPAVVIGASFGGMIAMVAFGEEPRPPLLSLVLVDITPRINNSGTDRVRSFMMSGAGGFASIEDAAAAVAAYLPHRPRRSDHSGLARNLRRGADGRYYWHWDPKFMTGAHMDDPDAVERRIKAALRGVEAPILLIRGGASDVVSSLESAEFAALLPNAEIIDIPGAHHMVVGDDNSTFASAVTDFVRRTAPLSF